MLPLLKGEAETLGDRALYWHFPCYLQAYSVYDEQRDPLFRTRPVSVIRVGEWKLHQYFEGDDLELYNLEKDIGETNNVAAKYPEKTEELLGRLKAWRERVGAPVPREANPKFDAESERKAIERKLRRLEKRGG